MGTKLIYLDDEGCLGGVLRPCGLGQPTAPLVGLSGRAGPHLNQARLCIIGPSEIWNITNEGGKGAVLSPTVARQRHRPKVSHSSRLPSKAWVSVEILGHH